MILSKKCIDLIKQFEGLNLNAYKCPAGVWTIGYGNTFYEDGSKIKEGQKISIERAEQLLVFEVSLIAGKFPELNINQNQFDALISFCYNVGLTAFLGSTLYKIIKNNPNDPGIEAEFKKWCKARVNGRLKILKGLLRRRIAESNLYHEKN